MSPLPEEGSPSASEVPGLGSARRGTRSSIASQVTFAGLFGSVDEGDNSDDASSESQQDEEDSTRLIRTNLRGKTFRRMENCLFLYLMASSFSRVNLIQVFRMKQCLSVLKLNLTQCEELFKLENVKTDDIKRASDLLIDARLGVEYAAGTIIVLLLSQYLVKYGLKHALLFCLIGSWLAHLLIYTTIYFMNVDTYYTILAATPLIISGGEILMTAITCTHIGVTSMGNERRSRFVAYLGCVMLPEAVARLLVAYNLPDMCQMSFELWAIVILSCLILLAFFFAEISVEGPESHSFKERIMCSMSPKSVRQTITCFSKSRPCRARFQLVMSICILSTSPLYFDFFSSLPAAYMSQNYSWTAYRFVRTSSATLAISCWLSVVINSVLQRYVRPLDPSVAAVGFCSLVVYYMSLIFTKYSPVFYYGGLIFLTMPILGLAALYSHVCQILDKSDMAPVLALICALTRVSHVSANRLWKLALTIDPSWWQVVFAGETLFISLIVVVCILLVIMTRAHGYPSSLF